MEDELKKAATIFARMGGQALSKKKGKDYYSTLGKKGAAKRWKEKEKKQ